MIFALCVKKIYFFSRKSFAPQKHIWHVKASKMQDVSCNVKLSFTKGFKDSWERNRTGHGDRGCRIKFISDTWRPKEQTSPILLSQLFEALAGTTAVNTSESNWCQSGMMLLLNSVTPHTRHTHTDTCTPLVNLTALETAFFHYWS